MLPMNTYKYNKLVLMVVVVSLLGMYHAPTSHSYNQDLSPLSISLSSNRAGANPGQVEVGFTPKLNLTNALIRVTFTPGWQLASLPSAFTLSTPILQTFTQPSGLTLSEVTSNTLTFSGSNLVADTTYGFRILSGITNPATAGNYPLTLELWNPNSLVASGTAGVSILNNNQIQVTGQILPQPEQLPFELSILNPKESYGPGETIEFELSVSNTLSYPLPLTLETSWQDGILQSGQLVSLLSYKPGSASGGPSGTTPIYLPAAESLRFEIASLPKGDHTIRFALITNTFTGSSEHISLTLTTRITNPPLTTSEMTSLTYYYFTPATTALSSCNQSCTQDNTCQSNYCHPSFKVCRNPSNPDSTSCAALTATPIPSPLPGRLAALKLTSISIQSLTASSIGMIAQLNRSSSLQIRYGTSPNALSQTMILPEHTSRHSIRLEQLTPNTSYYFQLQSGAYISDLMSVTTATPVSFVNQAPTMITSLYFEEQLLSLLTSTPGEFYLPTRGSVGLRVQLPEHADGLSVILFPQASTAQSPVQGVMDPIPTFRFDRVARSLFSGSIHLPSEPGKYQALAQIHFMDNSITQIPLANFEAISPLTIIDALTKYPVVAASIKLEYFEPQAARFVAIQLPQDQQQSGPEGTIPVGFGPGKYHLTITHPFYKPRSLDFELLTTSPSLPVIELEPYPAGPFLWLQIQYQQAKDVTPILANQLQAALSHPAAHKPLVSALIFLNSLGLVFTLVQKLHARHFFFQRIAAVFEKITYKQIPHRIFGTVVDHQTGQALSAVTIHAISPNQEVLASTSTDRRGYFQMTFEGNQSVFMTLLHPDRGQVTTTLSPSNKSYQIAFPSQSERRLSRATTLIARVLRLGFEFCLIASILLLIILFDQIPQALLISVIIITLLGLITQFTTSSPNQVHAVSSHE